MDRNSVFLSGELARSDALRYTPAGVPILEFRLFHSSTQMEGGANRKVELEINGLAVAETALALSGIASGTQVSLKGFLARKSAKSREIVFHTTHFELTG